MIIRYFRSLSDRRLDQLSILVGIITGSIMIALILTTLDDPASLEYQLSPKFDHPPAARNLDRMGI